MTDPQSPPRVKIPTQRDHTRCDIAGEFESLRGRRVVLVNETGEHHDFRVWSEALVLADGFAFIDVVRERHWYAADLIGTAPRVVRWPAGAAWLD